jgi:hypothetical protein
MKILTSFIIILFSNLFFSVHPVHVSVTNIDFDEKKSEYKISVKIFKDDFEKIVNSKFQVILNLGAKNELKNADELITKYIVRHFQMEFDGKNSENKIILQKKEIREDNAVWLFYKLKYKKIPKKVKITNTFLNDLYPDQKNLLIFTLKNTQEAITFDHSQTDSEFEIKN